MLVLGRIVFPFRGRKIAKCRLRVIEPSLDNPVNLCLEASDNLVNVTCEGIELALVCVGSVIYRTTDSSARRKR